jgi:hypothetical protein
VRYISNLPSASDKKLLEPHAQPPPMQIKSSGVQAVIHDEDRIVNNLTNTDPMLLTCDIETDISISKTTKDKFWNLEYTVLSLLLRQPINWSIYLFLFFNHSTS